MPFPAAAGHPNLSGTYIPQIYAQKLLVKFYAKTVWRLISNTEYEGQIKKFGDEVHIRTNPDITIRPYTKGQDLTIENPDPGKVILPIDKGFYYAFAVDKVDMAQADINMLDAWAEDASEQQKQKVDTHVLGSIYVDADSANVGTAAGATSGGFNLGATGSPVAVSKSTVIDLIVDCDTVLTEQNIPATDRWMTAPPWFTNRIKKSELKDASLTGDAKSLLRGVQDDFIGRIGMLNIFTSNNQPYVTDGADRCWNITFGHKSALTFASQILESEVITNPKSFGKIARGLQVFGYKVVKPDAMGVLYGKPA